MDWLLFLSQLPATPSSLRVSVWRKLRASGALGLQNGVWLLPHTSEQVKFLEDLLVLIQSQGASGQIFIASPFTPAVEQEILARFRAEREEEYAEFHERCQAFLEEIQKETGRRKFTFAELEENEQDLQRLESWLEKIQKRDLTAGDSYPQAASQLKACHAAFEAFSEQVYRSQANATAGDDGSAQP